MTMLDSLITSKTRIKLLIRLFLNPNSAGYLRGLADEFAESTNSVRIELNRLEEAGMLTSASKGKKKVYKANRKHPLFSDIQNILRKVTGIDNVINNIINHIGGLQRVYLVGPLAQGLDNNQIDVVLVGEAIDSDYLHELVDKSEKLVNRKINAQIVHPNNIQTLLQDPEQSTVLLWESNQ
jgi:hypothetical protein